MDLLWRKGRVYKQCIAVEWERCFFAARWQDTIQANNNGKLFLCLMVVPVSSAGTLVERQEISLPSCCTLKGIMWNVGQWPAAAESVRSIHGSKRERKRSRLETGQGEHILHARPVIQSMSECWGLSFCEPLFLHSFPLLHFPPPAYVDLWMSMRGSVDK